MQELVSGTKTPLINNVGIFKMTSFLFPFRNGVCRCGEGSKYTNEGCIPNPTLEGTNFIYLNKDNYKETCQLV